MTDQLTATMQAVARAFATSSDAYLKRLQDSARAFDSYMKQAQLRQRHSAMLRRRYGGDDPEIRRYHAAAEVLERRAKRRVDEAFERADVRLAMLQARLAGRPEWHEGCPDCYARPVSQSILAGQYECGRLMRLDGPGGHRTDRCRARAAGMTEADWRLRRDIRAGVYFRMQQPHHAIITGITA